MKILASPTCLDEARVLAELRVDIIDVKNPAEGSLGAQPPWVVREIVEFARLRDVPTSATLGDLPFKPGSVALAAFGMAHLGVNYIKAGLYGRMTEDEAIELLKSIRRAIDMTNDSIALVAAGYADYRRFGGLPPRDVVRAAASSGGTVVMLDTADKRAGTLFDMMSRDELQSFVAAARAAKLEVALAGSIGIEHLDDLRRLAPDIIGARGALCMRRDRMSWIEPSIAREFVTAARSLIQQPVEVS
jgi:hypothetical protein